MYKREFDRLLSSGPLPKSLMLYGDNDYYLDLYADAFIDKTGAKEGMLKLYYDEYDYQRAKNHLGQSSLFGDMNLLVVRSDKKIPKKELTHLIELAAKNETNFFLYLYTGSDFKSLTAAFSKKMAAEHVRFFPPNLKEAADILQAEAQRHAIPIDRYAIEHLAMTLNLNLALAVNELHKLALLGTPIGTKEIDEHVYSLAPMAMEEFLLTLFSRRPLTDALAQWHRLGEDEYAALRALQHFTTQLFLFHAYIKLHGAPDSREILGYRLPRPVEEQRAKLAVRLSPALFEKIFDALADGEEAMKRPAAATQKETLFFATLIKIKSFLG